MEKLRYELDPHNRLIAKSGRKSSSLSQFRYVMDGEFKIGRGNSLIYHIKSPSRSLSRQLNLPYQLKLRGIWSLTPDHNLRLTLDKCRLEGFRNEVVLKGEIIGAESDSLLFSVTQKAAENAVSTRVLRLEGTWQADKQNRLTFSADRESGKYDPLGARLAKGGTLTFEGAWDIGKNHQITYKYKKSFSERIGNAERSLAFNGFWNITEKGILTYHLDFVNKSLFNFMVGVGRAYKDSIKYEIGIGLENRKRPLRKCVILYGKWNIERVGLVFKINYGDDQTGGIVFAAEARLAPGSKIEFDLKAESGKPLGISLTLSKTIMNGMGELYSKALFSEKEKAVYIGAGFIW